MEGVVMEFEPIDEELEEYLETLIAKQDSASGIVENVDFMCAEYRGLKDLGFFAECDEFLDGTALVKLTYQASTYFKQKDKWKKGQMKQKVSSAGSKVAEVATDLGAEVILKLSGMR